MRVRGHRAFTLVELLVVIAIIGILICCPPASAATPELNPNWTWTETPWGRPVVNRGARGQWDHYAVDNPYVYSENGRYYCFFEAQDKPFDKNGHERFGVAVSNDGICWQKTGKPLLDVGGGRSWDSIVAKLPAAVIKKDGKYHLFYSGHNNKTKQIGMATSAKLTGGWSKSPRNPVIRSRPADWDKWISTYPAPLFQVGGRYFLLYRGMERRYFGQGLGVAVSDDLMNWRRIAECDTAPLTPPGEEIASLAVAKVGKRFVGISQPMGKSRRCYWMSDDLRRWEKGPKVEFKSSGRVDTLSNPFVVEGCWNVLYEQDDRIYRAVLMLGE